MTNDPDPHQPMKTLDQSIESILEKLHHQMRTPSRAIGRQRHPGSPVVLTQQEARDIMNYFIWLGFRPADKRPRSPLEHSVAEVRDLVVGLN